MQETNSESPAINKDISEPKIIQTDVNSKDGQNKCPKCGATEISLNAKSGMLRCQYCRHEFAPQKVEELEVDISQLEGEVIASGAQDIVLDTNDIVTFKCDSCGSEVVIDTSEVTSARCHWCRSVLSVNQQVPNGSVPDVVLPFNTPKDVAKSEIEKFVGKRKFFAHPKFKEEFTANNVMGVYFPYMIVDINSHAHFSGEGEQLIRRYTRGTGDNKRTYYDADLYAVDRDFDLIIDGLTVESSSDKLQNNASDKTNNVINAIMPFDVENCVKWNANYLKGYTSEKRDTNIEQLKPLVEQQSKDIARFAANDTIKQYDRGVAWSTEHLEVKGQQWKTAYLPVWLYSYLQVKGDKKLLHYVAVNARTKEIMGSVPINMPKLWLFSFLVELLAFLTTFAIEFEYEGALLFTGIIYFLLIFFRYRNSNARHKHETETKKEMSDLRSNDRYINRLTGLSNSMMHGANNLKVSNRNFANNAFDTLKQGSSLGAFVKNKKQK